MGIIMVAGITAKNGILLLDHAEHGIAVGLAPAKALIDAAEVRLRPILMTTLATAAGLFPLALGNRRGREGSTAAGGRGHRRAGASRCCCHPLAGGIYLLGTRTPRPVRSTPPENAQ